MRPKTTRIERFNQLARYGGSWDGLRRRKRAELVHRPKAILGGGAGSGEAAVRHLSLGETTVIVNGRGPGQAQGRGRSRAHVAHFAGRLLTAATWGQVEKPSPRGEERSQEGTTDAAAARLAPPRRRPADKSPVKPSQTAHGAVPSRRLLPTGGLGDGQAGWLRGRGGEGNKQGKTGWWTLSPPTLPPTCSSA